MTVAGRRGAIKVALALSAVSLACLPCWAAVPEVLPIEEIHPGMVGTGRTVFQGDTITEFGVEVLDVMHHTRPQGDLILFRAKGDLLEHTGIIAGMSGSPVWIDGKLVGAVAFAFPGAKDPIGAITPIGEMLPLLGPDVGAFGGEEESTGDAAPPGGSDAEFRAAWASFVGGALSPAARVPRDELTGMQPVALPIAMSGWAASLAPEFRQALDGLGFLAAGATGGSESAREAGPLSPGSAVGVQLVRGDADLTAIGTVTWVDDDGILAFGHPMIQAGRVAFPMTGAWIYGVIPSRSVSQKTGGATRLIGGIYNDRRAGIAGRVGGSPDLLPVRVTLRDEAGRSRTFRYEVVRAPSLTPFFLPWTISNSFLAAGWSSGDTDITSVLTVHHDGDQEVTRRERIASDAPGGALGVDVAMPASLLLINPFQRVRIDSLAADLTYTRRNPRATVTEVRVSPVRAEVGDTLEVEVRIEPFRGEPKLQRFSIPVTGAWAGREIRVLAGSTPEFVEWDRDRAPDKFTPHSFRQMLEMITRVPDDGELTVRAYAAEEGVVLQGIEIAGLPPSLAHASDGGSSRAGTKAVSGRLLLELRLQTPWVLSGGEQVEVQVAE